MRSIEPGAHLVGNACLIILSSVKYPCQNCRKVHQMRGRNSSV